MKVNEEIDAMQTLGLDPMEGLVLPRVLALVITLPMLAFIADVMGLLGGGLTLGTGGKLPPVAAAWRPNVSFAIVGIGLSWRLR